MEWNLGRRVDEVHISTDVCLRHELHIRAQDQICALHSLGMEFRLFWYRLVCFQKVREKQVFCFVFLTQVIKFLIVKISFLLGSVSCSLRAGLWKARRIPAHCLGALEILLIWITLNQRSQGPQFWKREVKGGLSPMKYSSNSGCPVTSHFLGAHWSELLSIQNSRTKLSSIRGTGKWSPSKPTSGLFVSTI